MKRNSSLLQATKDAPILLQGLEDAVCYGKDLVKRRLAAHAAKEGSKKIPEPRLVRLSQRLGLSDKEMYGMAFIALRYL